MHAKMVAGGGIFLGESRGGEKERLVARRNNEVFAEMFKTSNKLLMTMGSGDSMSVFLFDRRETGNGEVRNDRGLWREEKEGRNEA